MQTRLVPHTSCQTHPAGSCLSAPAVALTSLWHVQGDAVAFLSLPPQSVFCQSALWGHTVRVATAPAHGWAGSAAAALCLV